MMLWGFLCGSRRAFGMKIDEVNVENGGMATIVLPELIARR